MSVRRNEKKTVEDVGEFIARFTLILRQFSRSVRKGKTPDAREKVEKKRKLLYDLTRLQFSKLLMRSSK